MWKVDEVDGKKDMKNSSRFETVNTSPPCYANETKQVSCIAGSEEGEKTILTLYDHHRRGTRIWGLEGCV